jgi:hypothetical protein
MNTNNDATHSLDLLGHVLEFLTDYASREVLETLSTRPQLLELFAEGLLKVRECIARGVSDSDQYGVF